MDVDVMSDRMLLDGNDAAAYGAKLSRPNVIAVYPITPQTELANRLALMVAGGEINAQYIRAESEHSVMMCCAGASSAGARVFTASCSQGIAHMEEVIWMAAGYRLPVVMCVVNRGIAYPGGSPDHGEALLQRDNGWIQFFCETPQEVLDTIIQAYRIGEDEKVYLPVIVAYEGFLLSHTAMPVEIPPSEEIDSFLPSFEHKYQILDPDNPRHIGIGGLSARGHPFRSVAIQYQKEVAQQNAKGLIKQVDEEYGKLFGRRYGGLTEAYRCDDAEVVMITMGCMTGTAREIVDEFREAGEPMGLVKLKTFRPFPTEEIQRIGKNVKVIGFVDRNTSLGSAGGGIGFIETSKALYPLEDRPKLQNFIAGITGTDTPPWVFKHIGEQLLTSYKTGKVEKEVEWIGIKG